MAIAFFRRSSEGEDADHLGEMTNAAALNDRYLDFGLRPPPQVEEEVPEKEDLEVEPVRLWVVEGKKPPSLKVRWFIHDEGPRDAPSWFSRNITIPTSLSWTVHIAAVFFTAFWPSTRLEIAIGEEAIPVEIVFAPSLSSPSPGATFTQDFTVADPFSTAVADNSFEAPAISQAEPQDEAATGPDSVPLEDIAPEPPTIEDLIAEEIDDLEQVDALSAIASAPEPDLPDVEPIPEPEPPPPPPPVAGTGPEAPDPVDVAEPALEPAEAAPEAESPVPEPLLEDGALAEAQSDIEAPELFEPEDFAAIPGTGTPEVEVAVDGNDIPVDQEGESLIAEAPLPPEPAEPEVVEPDVPEPEPLEPEFLEPDVPEPELPEPVVPEPVAPEPVVSEPVSPEVAEPEFVEPQLAEPLPPEEPAEPEVAALPQAPPPIEEPESPPLFEEEPIPPALAGPDPLDTIEPDRDLAEQSLADLLEESEEILDEPEEPGPAPAEEPPPEAPAETETTVAEAPVEEGPSVPIPSARPFTIDDPAPEPEAEPEPEPRPEETQVAEADDGGEAQGGTPGGDGTGGGPSSLGDGQVASAAPGAQPRPLPNTLAPALGRPAPSQPGRPTDTFKPAIFNDPSLGNSIEYPERLRLRGIEGSVTIRVVVGPDGNPINVQVQRSSGSRELDRHARNTIADWRFIPAERNGTAVIDEMLLPFNFRLER